MTAPMTPSASTGPPVPVEVEGQAPGGLMRRPGNAAGLVRGGEALASPAAPLVLRVYGLPAPQGSKSAFRNKHTGRIQQVESSKRVKPWRQDVAAAARERIDAVGWERLDDVGIDVAVTFVFPRPKSHFRTGANAHLLRDAAPAYPITGPDVDKLVRSTLDALTSAGVWRDDKLVAHVDTWKVYESRVDGLAGALIEVCEVGE